MKLLYKVAVLGLVVLSACRKDPKPVAPQLPAGKAAITRSFHYPSTNNTETVNYTVQKDSVVSKAGYSATGQLVISFDVPFPKGNDRFRFTIDADKIKPGLIGEYQIVRSDLSGLHGELQVVYRYNISQFSWVEFGEGNAVGKFQITAYDATRKIMNGVYVFDMTTMHDPKVGLNNWVETKIHVEGNFENLQVQ